MAPLEAGGSPGTFGGGLGDFLGGFQEQSETIRRQNAADQATKDARDERVFTALANSDDPDIRAAAVTGLLTGKHPARGMDKWFGTVQNHPSYDTIKSLVSGGHEPFMDPTKRHGAEVAADIDAKIKSIQGSPDLTDAQKTRATLGVYGAQPPRQMPLESGTLVHQDGTEEAGFFDRGEGTYYNADYEPQQQGVKEFRRGGVHPTGSTSENSAVEPDKGSKTGYSKVYRDKQGKEVYRVEAPPPSSQTPSFTPVPTPGGIASFGTKSGNVSMAKGGEGVGRAESPGQDLNALRSVQQSIIKDAGEAPKPMFTGGTVSQTKKDAYNAALDAAAQKYGYADYNELQKKIGDAGGNVSAATPPPAVPPTVGAKKPQTDAEKKKIDVSTILDRLKKNRAAKGKTSAVGNPPPAR